MSYRILTVGLLMTLLMAQMPATANEGDNDHLLPVNSMFFESAEFLKTDNLIRKVFKTEPKLGVVMGIYHDGRYIEIHQKGMPLDDANCTYEVHMRAMAVDASFYMVEDLYEKGDGPEILEFKHAVDREMGRRIVSIIRKVILETRHSVPHPDTSILVSGGGPMHFWAMFSDGGLREGTLGIIHEGKKKMEALGWFVIHLRPWIYSSKIESPEDLKEVQTNFINSLNKLERLYGVSVEKDRE